MIKLSKKVKFTSMKEGTKDDYDLITIHDSENERQLFDRVINWLEIFLLFNKSISTSPSIGFVR